MNFIALKKARTYRIRIRAALVTGRISVKQSVSDFRISFSKIRYPNKTVIATTAANVKIIKLFSPRNSKVYFNIRTFNEMQDHRICDKRIAANISAQPSISLSERLCPRMTQPESALNTLSRHIAMLAIVGFIFF